MRRAWVVLGFMFVLAGCGGGGGGAMEGGATAVQFQQDAPAYAQAARLREQASSEVDWGSERVQLGMRVFVQDPDDLSRLFRDDQGAVMCQGAAYYLHLKYLAAGYRSYQVGFETSAYSHAIALVEVEAEDGSRVLTVQDPTFNHSYVDRDGHPMSVFDIMEALAEDRPQDIFIDGGPPPEVEYLWHAADPPPAIGSGYLTAFVGPSGENPALTVYRARLSLDAFEDMYAAPIRDYAVRHRVPESSLYLLFGRPIYAFKSYPMDDQESAEAAEVLNQLSAHYAALQAAH